MQTLDFSEVPEHIFSANEIRQYSECARKRYYSSRDCLAIRSTKPNDALLLGKKVHEMLEHYYLKGQQAIKEVIDDIYTETGEAVAVNEELDAGLVHEALSRVAPFQLSSEDAEALGANLGIFNCIHESYRERLEADLAKYEIIACEFEFKLNDWPIDNVQYHGQIDMIVRERSTNRIWFFEHKTSKDFRPEIYNRFDIQLHIYTAYGEQFARRHGYLWGGMVLNEIKKAKTIRGYAEHRMYYTYSEAEMFEFEQWLKLKTAAAISPENRHEPCNTYMTCKMCEYAPICLKLGYEVPKTHEEVLNDVAFVDEETKQPLYKYDPRGQEEENE